VIMVSAAYLVGRPDPAARQQDASAVPAEPPAADGVLLSEER
jgi:hypothetical protein